MRQLTCDQVFDILTRAPFPSGDEHDDGVNRHLAVCHDCRQLAEALRPATDLFREVMAADERHTLPVYRGELATIARPAAHASRRRHDSTTTQRQMTLPSAIGRRSGLPLALVPAIALLILVLFVLVRRPTPGSTSVSVLERASHRTEVVDDRAETVMCAFATMSLPSRCLPRFLVGPAVQQTTASRQAAVADTEGPMSTCGQCHELAPLTSHSRVCCTNCHAAANRTSPSLTEIHRLAASCSVCHI